MTRPSGRSSPDNTNLYQRLDLTGRYYFDKDSWNGWARRASHIQVALHLGAQRRLYWQSDAVNAYFGTLTGNTELTQHQPMASACYNNPNYTHNWSPLREVNGNCEGLCGKISPPPAR